MGLVSSQVLFLPENATEEREEVTGYRLDSETLATLYLWLGILAGVAWAGGDTKPVMPV